MRNKLSEVEDPREKKALSRLLDAMKALDAGDKKSAGLLFRDGLRVIACGPRRRSR